MMEHAESIPNLQELPLEDAIREKLKDSRELNMLVIGRYQVGKSTLINSLFFDIRYEYKPRAKEGSLQKSTTKGVSSYPFKLEGISCNIYDSPGLQDGEANDVCYLKEIKKKCPTIHLVIYCTRSTW